MLVNAGKAAESGLSRAAGSEAAVALPPAADLYDRGRPYAMSRLVEGSHVTREGPKSQASASTSRRRFLGGAAVMTSLLAAPAISRATDELIKIGIIAEESTINGAPIPKAAQMAVEKVNVHGGVLGRKLKLVTYDDHASSTEAVKAFERLARQDKVTAVIGSFMSEVALALEPWSARLKMPFITPGASSMKIPQAVQRDYDRFKYTFQGTLNAFLNGESICQSAHELLVGKFDIKRCVVMSEDADWTITMDAAFRKFLPRAGIQAVEYIRFSPDTTDFTPIFNKVEALKPDIIITEWAHVGVVPTVQWAEGRVPIPLYGENAEVADSSFWKDTHGDAEGAETESMAGPTSSITPQTVPFGNEYKRRYGSFPAYAGYGSYDMVFVIAEAIERASSTDPDDLVAALEKTDHVGTMGRCRFYGRDSEFAHALKYGIDLVPGVMLQWQRGQLRTVWPTKFADAEIEYPTFVRMRK